MAEERRGGVLGRRRFLNHLLMVVTGGLLSACGRKIQVVGTGPPSTATPRPTYTPAAVTSTAVATTTPSPPPATTLASPLATPLATSLASPLPPTYTPVPATPTPFPTPELTPVAAPPSRADLLAHWPQVEKSRVVVVSHAGVWPERADVPDEAIVLTMLDAGISALAGGADAASVWRTLFDPQERVLLKVNCIAAGGPTQPAVTAAVARRLLDAGLAAENVRIFDRTDWELSDAGYTLNEGGSGVQCFGSRGEGTQAVLAGATVRFFQEIDACDAIVNLPTPKGHGISGASCAMKNHFGSVNRPGALHGGGCDPSLPELNAYPLIKDKTRLIVAAALSVSPFDWNQPVRDRRLLFSFDPVAMDTVARDILVGHYAAQGVEGGGLVTGSHYLATAQANGLGATDTALIELLEVVLG